MKQTRMSSQQRGIERALAHLQQRVQARAPLPDLAELAAVAHQSPFHFHRVYRAMTGETVDELLRNLPACDQWRQPRPVQRIRRLGRGDQLQGRREDPGRGT